MSILKTLMKSQNIRRFTVGALKQYKSRITNFFHFYEDIPIKNSGGVECGIIRWFGITKYKYTKVDGKRVRYTSLQQNNERPPVFLKVDRYVKYTMMCIQHWVYVAKELGGYLYIVCDNCDLGRAILKEIEFHNLDFEIVASKRRELKKIGSNLYSYYWRNAAYAHLTSFYISKQIGAKQHWAIDADDTLFLMSPKEVASKLKNAEKKAIEDGITAFSLDMWWSCSPYENWSMGVMFVNENVDFFKIFETTKSKDWLVAYGQKRGMKIRAANIDYYFGYLGDSGMIKTDSFYFDNSSFVHWDVAIGSMVTSLIYKWREGKLHLPLLSAVPQASGFWRGQNSFDIKAIKID